jgi:hypothetical protein
MTKTWFFAAITTGWMLAAGVASACPTGFEGQRPVQPRPVQNVSFQASELVERANRLESAASSREVTARTAEADADTLANRARILRNQATFVNASDRNNILSVVDELVERAAARRAHAANERAEANQLRREARALRNQAIQLTGGVGVGGGGWRRPGGVPRATVLPSERVDL